jgi:hypothetical protein
MTGSSGRSLVLLILGLGLASACTNHSSDSRPSATTTPSSVPSGTAKVDLRPLVATAPFWCDFVSREAIRRVTGLSEGLAEQRSGWQADQGGCVVESRYPSPVLALGWGSRSAAQHVDKQAKSYAHAQLKTVKLPSALGMGFTVEDGRYEELPPYNVIAMFRCGLSQPWLSIGVRQISAGRDWRRDLVDLMRIAERRFGVLHGCTPKP